MPNSDSQTNPGAGSRPANMSDTEDEKRDLDSQDDGGSASARGMSDEIVEGKTEDVGEDPADPETN